MNGINPKWGMYLGLAVLLEQTIAHGGTALLAGTMPDNWIVHVTSTANVLAVLGTAIMTWQASVSSYAAGPLVNTVISPAAKAAIMFAVLGSFLAFAPSASAQPKLIKLTPKAQAFVNKVAPDLAPAPAPQPDVVTTLDQALDKLGKISADVVAKIVIDTSAADADAATLTNPADPASFKDAISHACYPSAVKFLQSLPVAIPMTGELQGVQLFQRKRDFINMVKGGLPDYLKIGCGALLGDETKILIAMLGMVGVTVGTAGLGLPAIPALALPALAL
jgi:hypothetical protein